MAVAIPQSTTAEEFQQLKNELHRKIVDSINLKHSDEMSQAEFESQLKGLAGYLCAQQDSPLDRAERDAVVDEIIDELYGFRPLAALMADSNVTDIVINGPDRVLVKRHGRIEVTPFRFNDEQHLMRFVQQMVRQSGQQISESNPVVDFSLEDGSRFNAVVPPLALNGATVSIRRKVNHPLSIESILGTGSLAPAMADFLILAVRGRMNVVVSGASGAGKTTLLNCMARFIPERERFVTIEESAELHVTQKDAVQLQTQIAGNDGRKAVTQFDLLKRAIAMRPDRIVVGEARGKEVLELLQAMSTRQAGSMTTVHANSVNDTLARLEMMIALDGADLPTRVARQFVASGVDVVVHTMRLTNGEYRVARISEVASASNGEYQLQDIFVYRSTAQTNKTPPTGAFFATGYEPNALKRLEKSGVSIDQFRPLFVPRELELRTVF